MIQLSPSSRTVSVDAGALLPGQGEDTAAAPGFDLLLAAQSLTLLVEVAQFVPQDTVTTSNIGAPTLPEKAVQPDASMRPVPLTIALPAIDLPGVAVPPTAPVHELQALPLSGKDLPERQDPTGLPAEVRPKPHVMAAATIKHAGATQLPLPAVSAATMPTAPNEDQSLPTETANVNPVVSPEIASAALLIPVSFAVPTVLPVENRVSSLAAAEPTTTAPHPAPVTMPVKTEVSVTDNRLPVAPQTSGAKDQPVILPPAQNVTTAPLPDGHLPQRKASVRTSVQPDRPVSADVSTPAQLVAADQPAVSAPAPQFTAAILAGIARAQPGRVTSPASEHAPTDLARPELSVAVTEPALPIAAASPAAPPAAATPLASASPSVLSQPQQVPPPPPVDLARIVENIARAREEAQAAPMASGTVAPVEVSVRHPDFGAVSLRFEHDRSDLKVALSSTDPDFARAVTSAAILPDRASNGAGNAPADTPPRQDGTYRQGSTDTNAQPGGQSTSNGQPRGGSERRNPDPASRSDGTSSRRDGTAPATGRDTGIFA